MRTQDANFYSFSLLAFSRSDLDGFLTSKCAYGPGPRVIPTQIPSVCDLRVGECCSSHGCCKLEVGVKEVNTEREQLF